LSADLDQVRAWIGRSEIAHDTVEPWRAQALAGALDRPQPWPQQGDALPPCWHWMLFRPLVAASATGPDGHPARGGFLPPVPLPRRMWAGSRLVFRQPLRVGEAVRRVSTVKNVTAKQGKSGPLVFVEVEHRIEGASGLAIEEIHDIVYRDAEATAVVATAAPAATGTWTRSWRPDEVLLFRYSALTYNGHRIHYDRRYVTAVENYPGLIVHGPLIATLLLELAASLRPDARIADFEFRARRPAFDGNELTTHAAAGEEDRLRLWATDHTGALAMEASARLSPLREGEG
jgi:3-methylfumaryl-CoA hydratase